MKYLIAIRNINPGLDKVILFRVSDRDQYQISYITYDNIEDQFTHSAFNWIKKPDALNILETSRYMRCFRRQSAALIHIGKLIGMTEIHI